MEITIWFLALIFSFVLAISDNNEYGDKWINWFVVVACFLGLIWEANK